MQHFLEGFVSALSTLAVVLLVRYLKDAFRAGISFENSFTE